MKKGKVLKVKLGYNPNSSMSGISIAFFVAKIGLLANIILSFVISKILYKKYRSAPKNKKY